MMGSKEMHSPSVIPDALQYEMMLRRSGIHKVAFPLVSSSVDRFQTAAGSRICRAALHAALRTG